MAVMQMQRISICALKKDRKAILEQLQALGVMEVDNSVICEDDLEKIDTSYNRQMFEKKATLMDHALEVLAEYAPEKSGLLSVLDGKALVAEDQYRKLVEKDNRKKLLKVARHLLEQSRIISENTGAVQKLENQIEALTPWLSLDVSMDFAGTKETAFFVGMLPAEADLQTVNKAVFDNLEGLEAYEITTVSKDKDLSYVAVLCRKADAQALEKELRTFGFARPSQPVLGVPKKVKADCEQQIQGLKADNEKVAADIKTYDSYRDSLKELSDYYRIRAEKYSVLATVPQSENTFIISGYVPMGAEKLIRDKIENRYDCSVDIEALGEEETAPVLLKNGPVSSTTEGILASFGLPKAGELDPTRIMSFFYIILFGMMLSDAGYGLVIFLGCLWAVTTHPRMEEGLKKTLTLFMYCGASTVVWGLLFGGFFGDIVTVVSTNYFNSPITLKPLWFDPLGDPTKLLIISMIIGLIHLYTGLLLKAYQAVKQGDVMTALIDAGCWFLFLTGLILMLIPTDIFAGIAGSQIILPAFCAPLSKAITIIGGVGLLLFAARDNKNSILRILLGAYEIYGITSWLSDILSYSRLLGLGLATGVIAQVVNKMGSMAGTGVVGTVIFIIVFIFGHSFSLAINLLGAYVHTNRLQYVEFFGKFYEGGGRAFAPFKNHTKYVDIKEEN